MLMLSKEIIFWIISSHDLMACLLYLYMSCLSSYEDLKMRNIIRFISCANRAFPLAVATCTCVYSTCTVHECVIACSCMVIMISNVCLSSPFSFSSTC